MTPPIAPIPDVVVVPRASVGMKVVDVADHVIVKLIGLIIFASSGYFEYIEVTSDKITSHLILFACSAAFGIALAFTRPVVATAAAVLTVVGPYIPGRRSGDT